MVLISGSGSNLQAIIDASKTMSFEVVAVISNKSGAYGLQRAANANIATVILNHQDFSSREDYDLALIEAIDQFSPKLVVLAGFMRILSAPFVEHYQARLLNIHPSLLPKFKGLHTHQRALAANEKEHGASVHFVTEDLDSGLVLLQARVAVKLTDTEASLAQRVLEKEHQIYPKVIEWIATGRLKPAKNQFQLDDKVYQQPLLLENIET